MDECAGGQDAPELDHGQIVLIRAARRPLPELDELAGADKCRDGNSRTSAPLASCQELRKLVPCGIDQNRAHQRQRSTPTDPGSRFVERGEPDQGTDDNIRGIENERGRQNRRSPADVQDTGRQEPTIAAQDECRQRGQRRDEEDETPLVRHVVNEKLECAETDPHDEQPLRWQQRAPARERTQNRNHADNDQEPQPREDVVDDGKPRHTVEQRPRIVAGFPRHRHLPVVELVVRPVRNDKQRERDERRIRRGRQPWRPLFCGCPVPCPARPQVQQHYFDRQWRRRKMPLPLW